MCANYSDTTDASATVRVRHLLFNNNCPILTNKDELLQFLQQLPDDARLTFGFGDTTNDLVLYISSRTWPVGATAKLQITRALTIR